MADHVASIRATLKANAFSAGMREAAKGVASEGKKMGSSLGESLRHGIHGAKESLGEFGRELKHMLGLAVGLGGAFEVGEQLKEAVQLQSKFRDIAYNVSEAGQQTLTWQQAQEMVEKSAAKTGQRGGEMADAFDRVFKETGNLETAEASLDAIGAAASLGKGSVRELADVVPMLQEKFGIVGKEIPDAFAVLMSKVGHGGVTLENLGFKFEQLAGAAADAGMTGAPGLAKLLDISNMLDDRLGKKATPALKGMLEKLREGTGMAKAFRQHTGVDLDKFKGLDKLKAMTSGKGRAQAELMFTGDMRTVFDQLMKPFDETVAKAKEGGKSQRDAEKEGRAALDAMFEDLGKSGASAAKLLADAGKRIKEDPLAQWRKAQETMAQAFADPELMGAVADLAKNLPAVAKAFASFVKFMIKNPLTGGAMVAGAVGAKGFAGSMAGQAVQLLFSKGSAGHAGEEIASAATKSSAWSKAGSAIGIAAAALIAYEVGKEAIDRSFQDQADAQGGIAVAGARGETSSDPRVVQASIDAVKKHLGTLNEQDTNGRMVAGKVAHALTGAPEDQIGADIKKGQDTLAALQAHQQALKENATAHRRGTTEVDHLTHAAGSAARELAKLKAHPTGPSKGPKGTGTGKAGADEAEEGA